MSLSFSPYYVINVLLILLVVVLSSIELYCLLYLNEWRGVFWEYMSQRDSSQFWPLIMQFSAAACICVYSNAASNWLENKLALRWRIAETKRKLARFKQLISTNQHGVLDNVDNPEQRITDDVKQFTTLTVWIIVCAVFYLAKFCLFVGLLISLSIQIFHNPAVLPLGTIGWAAIGLFLAFLVGYKLVSFNFNNQRAEASLRLNLIKSRVSGTIPCDFELNNQIGAVEYANLRVLRRQKWLNLCTGTYDQLGVIVPILILAPAYFASSVFTFGLFMQAINGFAEAVQALSVFVLNYNRLTEWRTCKNRLANLNKTLNFTA